MSLWKEPGQGFQVGPGNTRREGTRNRTSRGGFDEVTEWQAVLVQTWKPRMPSFGFAGENEWEITLKTRL